MGFFRATQLTRAIGARARLITTVVLVAAGSVVVAVPELAAAEAGSPAVGWGHNAGYSLSPGYSTIPGETHAVAVLAPPNITSLASGVDFTLALLSDGTLRAWGGGNARGQYGDGERGKEGANEETGSIHETENGPVQTVNVLSHATAVAAHGTHAMALENEEVFTWGDNEYGERGNGELNPDCGEPPTGPGGKTKVYSCTKEEHEQCAMPACEKTMQGSGATEPVSEVKVENPETKATEALTGVTVIGAGTFADYAAKRTAKGEEVLAWGDNERDELGSGVDGAGHQPEGCKNEFAQSGKEQPCSTRPRKVVGLPSSLAKGETHVVQIVGSKNFALLLLSDGTAWSWGENSHGQLGTKAVKTYGSGPETRTPEAHKVEISEVTQIAAGVDFALAIAHGGQVWGWGGDGEQSLGETPHENCASPLAKTEAACIVTPVKLLGFNAEGRVFTSIAAAYASSLAATTAGEVYSVGRNEHGELGRGRTLGWTKKAQTEPGISEEAAEIAAELVEDHEVRLATGVPRVRSLDASDRFVIALLAPGEPAPAQQLTITPKHMALEINWAFNIEPGEEWTTRWFTYEPCDKGGAACTEEIKGPEHHLPSTQHTYTFTEVKNTRPHRVVLEGGSRSAYRKHVIWGTPLGVGVSGLSPNAGPGAGGTTVNITGTQLAAATAVKFGSVNAASFKVNSETSVTAVSPPGSGTVDVTVVTPAETSVADSADRFSYVPAPTVTSISPNKGPHAGGTAVTVTGTAFVGSVSVKFGSASATRVTVNSETSLTAVAPEGTGTVDVTVTAAGGTSSTGAADHFTYEPSVNGVSPASGSQLGGTVVTITGTGFTGATAVAFGANSAITFKVESATSITAISPAGSGTVDVTVTTPAGVSSHTPADQFTYQALP